MTRLCKHCKHGEKMDDQPNAIRCRRFPPQMMAVPAQNQITQQAGVTIMPMFPQLAETEYCGEWEAAPVRPEDLAS